MTTTNLQKLRKKPENYTWGRIINITDFGSYSIVKSIECLKPQAVTFHCYVNNEDTMRSFSSFDEAVVFCVAYRQDGNNTRAHEYFMKMIK